MRIVPAAFEGVFLLDIEPREDERGFLARTFSSEELSAFGMQTQVSQAQIALTARRGTVRGLYFQRAAGRSASAPPTDSRLVRCTHGRVFDVFVDLRPASPTFKRWDAVELSGENRRSIYLPPGFAHGYQALTDQAELLYLLAGSYPPEPPSGFRYDDPAFAVAWPEPATLVSPRDLAFPTFESS
jgi:dTDP-4-dehydrorhamnose 3,5-epimerase